MLDQIQDLAQSTLPAYRYNYAKQFIAEHIAAHPVSGLAVNAVNTAFEWDEFLKQYGDQGSFPIGTISEVSADLGDKVNGQVYNISHSLSWTKDMVEMKLEQDSTYAKLMLQLDTLEADFKRLVVVVEYVPEIADYIMKQLTERINEVLGALNSTVENAFYRVNYQREALQDYVTLQSDSLVAQAQRAADAAVDNALQQIPGLIGEVLLYIVLFFLVVLSVPFVLGYLLGKEGRKNKKTGGMASDDDGPDAV